MHPRLRQTIPNPIYRLLRARRIRGRIASYAPRNVQHSYAGHRLTVALRDGLGEGWYDHDWEIQPEIEALKRGRLASGSKVFDLGAHQAVVAMMLAQEVGPEGSVVAVEAEPHNIEVAEINLRLNAAANIVLVGAAVADEAGHLFFSEGLNGAVLPGGRIGKIKVEAVTIDDLANRFGRPDVVFLDVEGYEERALRGATRTLDDRRTDFFVEIHDAATLRACGGSALSVAEHFLSRGYRCFVAPAVHGPIERDFEPLDVSTLNRGERCYLVAYGGKD